MLLRGPDFGKALHNVDIVLGILFSQLFQHGGAVLQKFLLLAEGIRAALFRDEDMDHAPVIRRGDPADIPLFLQTVQNRRGAGGVDLKPLAQLLGAGSVVPLEEKPQDRQLSAGQL